MNRVCCRHCGTLNTAEALECRKCGAPLTVEKHISNKTREVVINACFGGFGLSHAGVMRYAELAGIKLYAFVDARDAKGNLDFHKVEPYTGQENAFVIHYSKSKAKNGKINNDDYFSVSGIERNDPFLIQVVKELGNKADGNCAELKVLEIPEGIQWEIDEYDGFEKVEEAHQSWS